MTTILTLLASATGVTALATDTSTDPVAWLVNYGVAGIVIVLLVTGQLRTKTEVTLLERQMAQKDRVIEAFQQQLTSHTLPALAESTRVLEAIPSSESALLIELHRVRADAEALVARLETAARQGDETP